MAFVKTTPKIVSVLDYTRGSVIWTIRGVTRAFLGLHELTMDFGTTLNRDPGGPTEAF